MTRYTCAGCGSRFDPLNTADNFACCQGECDLCGSVLYRSPRQSVSSVLWSLLLIVVSIAALSGLCVLTMGVPRW